jgi:hypothetical protein
LFNLAKGPLHAHHDFQYVTVISRGLWRTDREFGRAAYWGVRFGFFPRHRRSLLL